MKAIAGAQLEDLNYKAGNDLFAKGDYRGAATAFTRAIDDWHKFNDNYIPSLYYKYRGMSYYKAEEYGEAIKDFTEAMRRNPKEEAVLGPLTTDAGEKLLKSVVPH